MSTQPSRHLRPAPEPVDAALVVLNLQTGEQTPLEEHLQGLSDELAGAERDLKTWRRRHAELTRDRWREAQDGPLWPAAVAVFDYWRKQCKHPRSEWTLDRFEMIRPHLERSNTGKGRASKLSEELIARNVELCKLAIDGIAFDPFVTVAKNGRKIVHDGLHLIFEGTDVFEKRCKMAPAERIREVFPSQTPKEKVDEPKHRSPNRADDDSRPGGDQSALPGIAEGQQG